MATAIVKMEVDIETSEDIKPNIGFSGVPAEEPLLGSLTTISNIAEGSENKGQQLRSSARVFKKMKLDTTVAPVVETAPPEKKEETKQDIKKCYRPLWASDDKAMFFEALNECGKDFEAIQMYISTKLRKKGVPENLIKTKDQVRHLYYRTWHKLSKYVKFSEDIKKVAQELYCLINYGELKKKIGSVSQKWLPKLSELVYSGSTVIRNKGKTIRVKTPMCRALRKLNQLDEKYDEIRLPNRVHVELRPKDMTSFLKVQSMAQNPRVQTTLPLQKRLSSLIECLNKRWQTVDAKIYEKALVSTNPITDSCVPPTSVSEETKKLLSSTLRLTPPADCKINIISINISEYFTRKSICLHSYEHRIRVINAGYSVYNNSNCKLTGKNNSKKRSRTDSNSDKFSPKSAPSVEDNDARQGPCDVAENEQISDAYKVVNEVVNAIHALHQSDSQETDDELVKVKVENKEDVKNDIQNDIHEKNQAFIDKIRQGWTEQDSESVSLGELYLMFGSDMKLILEYSWESPFKTEATEGECKSDTTNEDMQDENLKKLDLSHSLSKLLSVAKLHYRKNIIKCPCGHVCGSKNNVRLKRAMEPKIIKILNSCADETDEKATPEENVFENGQEFVTSPVYIQPNIQLSPATYFHQPNTQMVHLVSQINSMQRLKPRYCKGRKPRSKPVVERKLPLLPNKMESGHQIVRMNIISQESTSTTTTAEPLNFDIKSVKKEGQSIFINQDKPLSTPLFPDDSHCAIDIISKSIDSNEIVLELPRDSIMSIAPSSPSRILKEDNQWISSEVADYSLSSLLGHLESPIKSSSSVTGLNNDDSRMSHDVDAQISSLLTESSLDFAANFADLAAQVTNEAGK
ncbi:hypothetical protein NQ315_000542 [Exocentrus adspersus]|uniref:Cramped n=1 Tax=Exocentrus adspersus TaxID=1586481 RepID=A0AAV8VAQ6_9CUCU|nr:hypothetical protein NQ315_000542 [Exocentrus adspersus]